MDFSCIPHYLEQAFKNVTTSVTETAYVYFSKVNETSSFTLTMTKKFDLLEIEFETEDQRLGQKFSFDEKLNYKKKSTANLCSLLFSIVQNLDKVGTWGTRSFDLEIERNRTKFIAGEFERLAAIYGVAKPYLKNYLLIEGQGESINFPPGLGLLVIFKDNTVTFASGQDWRFELRSGSVGLFKLIGWWFHRREEGETFEEWQKAPLRGFGLPEEPEPNFLHEVPQPPEPVEPEVQPISHDQRFWDIYTKAMEMAHAKKITTTELLGKYEKVSADVRASSGNQSIFPYYYLTETFEQLLVEAGYKVTHSDRYTVTVSW